MEKWRLWFSRFICQEVTWKLNLIIKELWKMTEGMALLQAKLAEVKTVNDSILALITDLNGKVQNATTLEEVQTFVAEMEVEKQRLLDKINEVPA